MHAAVGIADSVDHITGRGAPTITSSFALSDYGQQLRHLLDDL